MQIFDIIFLWISFSYMKWIFITLAAGVLGFMAYSTYSSINTQLQSSAIGNGGPAVTSSQNVSVEKVEKTLTDTKNQQAK